MSAAIADAIDLIDTELLEVRPAMEKLAIRRDDLVTTRRVLTELLFKTAVAPKGASPAPAGAADDGSEGAENRAALAADTNSATHAADAEPSGVGASDLQRSVVPTRKDGNTEGSATESRATSVIGLAGVGPLLAGTGGDKDRPLISTDKPGGEARASSPAPMLNLKGARKVPSGTMFRLMNDAGDYLHEGCGSMTDNRAYAWKGTESQLAAVRKNFSIARDLREVPFVPAARAV